MFDYKNVEINRISSHMSIGLVCILKSSSIMQMMTLLGDQSLTKMIVTHGLMQKEKIKLK